MKNEGRKSPATICIGVISSPHGIKGAVKIKAHTSSPLLIKKFKNFSDKSGKKINLTVTSATNDFALAKIDGVETRNQAEELKGTEIFISRDEMSPTEEGEFYFFDLIGLEVRSSTGQIIGEITGIYNFGAGDIVEIKKEKKEEFLPFDEKTVIEVNIKDGYVIIDPPEEIYVR